MGTQTESAGKCPSPFQQRNDPGVPCQAPAHTSTRFVLQTHRFPFSSSTQQRKPLKQVHKAPDVGLRKTATKWSLAENGCYKKRRDFAIHFRNSHYQVVTILLSLQKHRNSHLPLSLPVSAGSLGCFHVHPHLSFLT